MNIAIGLGVAAAGVCVLWVIQSVVLTLAGEPLAWPWRFPTRRPLLRWTSRVMVHTEWLIILIGTPIALGVRPLDALHQALSYPRPVARHRDRVYDHVFPAVPGLSHLSQARMDAF